MSAELIEAVGDFRREVDTMKIAADAVSGAVCGRGEVDAFSLFVTVSRETRGCGPAKHGAVWAFSPNTRHLVVTQDA